MDPIVGCWVHPTSAGLTHLVPDAEPQHGNTGESLYGSIFVILPRHFLHSGVNLLTTWQDNLTAILYKTDDIRLEQQDVVEPGPDQVS